MIDGRSNYGEVMAQVQLAVADVAADLGVDPLELPDDAYADVVESVLYDANPQVGMEVCRTQLGFVPTQLHRHWYRVPISDRPGWRP